MPLFTGPAVAFGHGSMRTRPLQIGVVA